MSVMMSESNQQYIIVGLGNPGPKYHWTRHNIGFLCLYDLARSNGLSFKQDPWSSYKWAAYRRSSAEMILVLPQTYMNRSGFAVQQVLQKYALEPKNCLIVVDDFHLPFGKFRIRPEGSEGGHNGLKSVSTALGTHHYPRLRIGISQPTNASVDYVLGEFDQVEQMSLSQIYAHVRMGIETWVSSGINEAMEKTNRQVFSLGKDLDEK